MALKKARVLATVKIVETLHLLKRNFVFIAEPSKKYNDTENENGKN